MKLYIFYFLTTETTQLMGRKKISGWLYEMGVQTHGSVVSLYKLHLNDELTHTLALWTTVCGKCVIYWSYDLVHTLQTTTQI